MGLYCTDGYRDKEHCGILRGDKSGYSKFSLGHFKFEMPFRLPRSEAEQAFACVCLKGRVKSGES